MVPHPQSLTTNLLPSILPTTTHFPKSSFQPNFNLSKSTPSRKSLFQPLRCSVSVVSEPPQFQLTNNNNKPFPAEVSRTIMELSSAGTLSTLTQDTWPIGVGVRFAVDPEGTPIVCLNASNRHFAFDKRSSLNVQFEQCGLRTPQCTIQGNLDKPADQIIQKFPLLPEASVTMGEKVWRRSGQGPHIYSCC